jgi:hypothetical protein
MPKTDEESVGMDSSDKKPSASPEDTNIMSTEKLNLKSSKPGTPSKPKVSVNKRTEELL